MRCYFNQFASRDRQGYCWRNTSSVREEWLREFMREVWDNLAVLPKSGSDIKSPYGGFFKSADGSFRAVFRFCPAPPDFVGRKGGIVANVLFFDDFFEITGKSLKNIWEHPILETAPNGVADSLVFISPDREFGIGEERTFFSCHDHSEYKIVLYPTSENGGRCKILENKNRAASSVSPATPVRDRARENKGFQIMNFIRGPFSFDYVAGIIAGAIIVGVICWFIWPKPSRPPKSSSCEFDLPEGGAAVVRVVHLDRMKGRVRLRVTPVDSASLPQNRRGR